MRIRLGTRASALAVTQSQWVADRLIALGHEVELVEIRTTGDVRPDSLARLGGTGVFAAALREALLDGVCDIAVHSCKDLPTAGVDGLVIAAIPARERTDDVLCARDGLTLATLPAGARIGTGSPRRAAQIRALRPDVELVDIRGNVGTRLARVAPGDCDAVVLAGAGLARLGWADRATDSLPILPAPAQGALAVECRAGDAELRAALAILDDPAARWEVDAERAVLATLGAGCAAPVGARAIVAGDTATLTAVVTAVDGSDERRAEVVATLAHEAATIGRTLAERLLALGAADITDLHATKAARATHSESLWSAAKPLDGLRILVPDRRGSLADALTAAGADVHLARLTDTIVDPDGLARARAELGAHAWVVLSSPQAATLLGESLRGIRVAAVGAGTAEAARAHGADVALLPSTGGGAEALLADFPTGAGTVLLPGSALAAPTLREGLAERGWTPVVIATYTTIPRPLTADATSAVDVALVTAGSTARALVDAGLPVVTLGEPSAAVARELGLRVVGVATTPDPDGVVAAVTAARGDIR